MTRVAWIVGGGSGIGRGAAVALASPETLLVVSGRRADELAGTVDAVRAAGGVAHALPLDVSDPDAVRRAEERICAEHGPVRLLVYSAGTNVPNRFWEDTTPEDFARVVDVNLTGAMRTVHAVLPGMREAGDGLVVLVSSWAGWRFAPGVGAGYSTSKSALGALAETINAQERLNGVRATHFCPGEVATEILDTRPQPPSPAERALMLTADDIGTAIRWIADLPARICMNEIVLTPTSNTSYA
ncbi:SDR family oxidoreductase [Microbacterium sp. ASV81]|uniref:SDR family NAD(P)-dependent oxidoreductase n=1 Tax=Microbacterium capsulatum TaxID=3041921 RepID=A0ABU0XEH5_9MICO|nr:SDR family NAD(P)-dependent oxidoreductase [Microbacterium sp. ASV81]MDQ4213493.1 SDR family NAD(P)-dependent oxidoreductase [Microbacterium sp. ASV81]